MVVRVGGIVVFNGILLSNDHILYLLLVVYVESIEYSLALIYFVFS